MICPHCKKDIPDKEVARHLASKGGKAASGSHKITPEHQRKLQAGRKKLAASAHPYPPPGGRNKKAQLPRCP